MARKRKTKPQAHYKPWLALLLAVVVMVQMGYFSGAIQALQPTQTVAPKAAQSPLVTSTPPAPQPTPGLEPKPNPSLPDQKLPGRALEETALPITPPSQDPLPEALEQPGQPPALTSRPAPNPPPQPLIEKKFHQPSSPYTGVVRRVVPVGEEKLVALTFDDGPWPDTLAVLEVLRQYEAKATFFWVGMHLQKRPEIAQQVVAEGHAIGNHTWSHRNTPMTPEEAGEEIERTAALIQDTTGLTTSLFRPPGGRLHNGLADYALQQGYTVVQWSVLSEDTGALDAAAIVDNVLHNVQPGSIVLLHDGGGDRSKTVEALHTILPALQAQGYRFVTVPELLESNRAAIPKAPSN
ncbi:MAG: polysaccharide deacetylase family protein [Meiothermus sp.]|nr:polysaccharide deacetylase family protein [Meiothermus sp.]